MDLSVALIALVLFFLPALLGLILGLVARSRILASAGQLRGLALANWAIGLSAVSLGFSLLGGVQSARALARAKARSQDPDAILPEIQPEEWPAPSQVELPAEEQALPATDSDDHGNDAEHATPVYPYRIAQVGSLSPAAFSRGDDAHMFTNIPGVIEKGGDEDWFSIELVAGKPYEFNLDPVQDPATTSMDPLLLLIAPEGGLLERNDDGPLRPQHLHRGGSLTASQITHTATRTATHYLCARHIDTTHGVGAYTLAVRLAPSSVETVAQVELPLEAKGAPDNYFVSAEDEAADTIAGFPWLRRVPGLLYSRPRRVSRILYRKYQPFDDFWRLVQECEGEFVFATSSGDHAYQLKRIDETSLLAKWIGLRPGDTVVSSNGHPIGTTVAANRALHEQLRNETRFAILIERDGRLQVLPHYVEE